MIPSDIKSSVETLPFDQRRELVSYLVHLEHLESADFLDRITSRIDSPEQFEKWESVRNDSSGAD